MIDQYTIHKEVIVNASQEKAFRVFTEGFDSWWPKTHHIAKVEMKESVMETKLGGRWYEKGIDGSECDWGKVIAWEPPKRFALTWQLTADYTFDPNFQTKVEVTFEAQGDKKTRVVLEHKNLDRYGADMEKVKGSVGGEGGWSGIMKLYAATANDDIIEIEKMSKYIADRMAEQTAE
jgi:uncharacterized protein YndB with AHSA1/START domain